MKLRNWIGTSLAVVFALVATGSASAQVFGPDAFGYLGNRTNNPGAFTTIKGAGGVLQTPADPANALFDDRFYMAPIGFGFNYYGTSNTTAFLSTNGFMSFGGTTTTSGLLNTQENTAFSNSTFATNTLPLAGMQVDRALIAPWWDDMQFTNAQAGGIYTLTRTVGLVQEFVVEWNNVAFFNATANGVTFQAILRDDGTMTFIYPDVTNGAAGTNGAQATIGLHNLGGTLANNNFLQFSHNLPGALVNGDVINFTAVPEPSSMALCGLGVAAFGYLRRRRAAKA